MPCLLKLICLLLHLLHLSLFHVCLPLPALALALRSRATPSRQLAPLAGQHLALGVVVPDEAVPLDWPPVVHNEGRRDKIWTHRPQWLCGVVAQR